MAADATSLSADANLLPSRAMGTHTISAVVPFVVAKVAQAKGADPEPLLRGTGIGADKPPPAEDQLEAEKYFAVWRRAVALLGPAHVFDVARTFQLEDHEVFGFLAISCETLGQAYERTAAVRALYCTGARWDLEDGADASRLVWIAWPGDPEDPGYHAANEFAAADMLDAIRRLGKTSPMPREVRLSPRTATDGASAYYGVPPAYGAHACELVYPPGLPALPIATFNSRLRQYFDDVCSQLVATLPATDAITAQLRKRLYAAMDGGDTSIEGHAKALGMSARSLQRRLADEGTKYNDVLGEVQLELAKRYLSRGTVTASEVAYLVGFAEPPAFFKAFKRWTGMTPREFQLAT